MITNILSFPWNRPKETSSCCKTYLAPLTPLQPDLYSWRPKILHRHSLGFMEHVHSVALHLPFLIKIAKIITLTSSVPTRVDSKYFLREAPWLQWELHYLSGLIDDARSRKVIWMEITVAESHYLEDKQSNKSASVLLTQCGTWQGQTDFSGSSSRSNRDTRHVPRVDKSCMIWVERCESSLRQDLVTAGLERIDTFQNLNKRQKQRWFSYFTSR